MVGYKKLLERDADEDLLSEGQSSLMLEGYCPWLLGLLLGNYSIYSRFFWKLLTRDNRSTEGSWRV